MAQLGEAIARYHKLFDDAGFRDLAWAEAFQERMRERRLTESGRLLAPVLRPQFLSRRQLDLLTSTAERISAIAGQVVQFVLASPPLLNRLKLLPVEKVLAAAGPASSGLQVVSRVETLVENGSLSIRGLGGFTPAGVACSSQLADMFLDLPIVKEFKRGKYKLSKPGGAARLHAAVVNIWKELGGRAKPNIAIVQLESETAESQVSSQLSLAADPSVRLVSAGELTYEGRRLRDGDFAVDIVLRCVTTRDLAVRFGLEHPLFSAYRDGAVCVVDSFDAEIARRRAFFELLTDDNIAARLAAADRKLIRTFVPWTRVVFQRKTEYEDRQIDLFDFILRNREKLVLRPNEDLGGQTSFAGAAMSQPAWERALRLAIQTPYVVQEISSRGREQFPVYQYGELQMRELEVSIHPNLLNGRMQGASATLEISSPSGSSLIGAAPVLLLESLKN